MPVVEGHWALRYYARAGFADWIIPNRAHALFVEVAPVCARTDGINRRNPRVAIRKLAGPRSFGAVEGTNPALARAATAADVGAPFHTPIRSPGRLSMAIVRVLN